jgi:hypothetical protein
LTNIFSFILVMVSLVLAIMQSEFDRIRVPFMVIMAVFSVVVTWHGWFVRCGCSA